MASHSDLIEAPPFLIFEHLIEQGPTGVPMVDVVLPHRADPFLPVAVGRLSEEDIAEE